KVSISRPLIGQATSAAIAPRARRMRISFRLISANASSHTKTASSTSTGTSATPQCRPSVRIQFIALHDLKRSEPFRLAIMAVAPAASRSEGQDHWKPEGDREVQVELCAHVRIMVTGPIGLLGGHAPDKDCRANIAEEEDRRSDFGEADRRQIHLARQLGKAACGDLVDRKAGKALNLAIAFLRPVIDIVVAEGAEVESGQWIEAPASDRPSAC